MNTPENQALGVLRQYDISPTRGFLLEEDPLTELPKEYEPLNLLNTALPSMIATGTLREELERLPVVMDLSDITDGRQLRLAHVILTHAASGYVYMEDPPAKHIPAGIAAPLCFAARKLDMQPILCHAPFALWNWRRRDPSSASLNIDNLKVITSFLNLPDESWFTLKHTEIEARGGVIPYAAFLVQESVRERNPDMASHYLSIIAGAMESICESAYGMYDGLNEDVFFSQIRRFLHGFRDMEYKDVAGMAMASFIGNSGSQSLLFYVVDAICGVEHEPGRDLEQLITMREYAPPAHRRYLELLEAREQEDKNGQPTRSFVMKHRETHPELAANFNACGHWLVEFSDTHIGFTDHYIAAQEETSAANPKGVGTAGSHYHTYLRKHREERAKTFV